MGPRLAFVFSCCLLCANVLFTEWLALPHAGLAAAPGEIRQEPPAQKPDFEQWLEELRAEAVGRGIRPETLDAAFKDLEPLQVVTERDASQAEFTLTLEQYLGRRLT
ncbi:MAG: hypothetical protein EHM13_05415, partial [Acidobacteria bacterium]